MSLPLSKYLTIKSVAMAEIGYRVNQRYWHQGIATEIVRTLIPYLFDYIGLSRIQATVMPQNIFSARALLKNGFTKKASSARGPFGAAKVS